MEDTEKLDVFAEIEDKGMSKTLIAKLMRVSIHGLCAVYVIFHTFSARNNVTINRFIATI
jgi:hypothetical protein